MKNKRFVKKNLYGKRGVGNKESFSDDGSPIDAFGNDYTVQ